jgi:hypothetical protein
VVEPTKTREVKKMAKQVKVVNVVGQKINRGGVRISTLPEEIEKALQKFYDNPAIENIDVRPEVQFDTASTGGNALLIVTYDEKVPEKAKK